MNSVGQPTNQPDKPTFRVKLNVKTVALRMVTERGFDKTTTHVWRYGLPILKALARREPNGVCAHALNALGIKP